MKKLHEIGEVVCLRKFKFVPKKAGVSGKREKLATCSRFLLVKILQAWKTYYGTENYVAIPTDPTHRAAVWVNKHASPRENRIFFSSDDILTGQSKS